MHLDVESIVTLNALHRAEIRQEIVGTYRVRQPWAERLEARRVCPLRRPFQALRHALSGLRVPAPVKRPII
jgi:hypothetical protein